MARALTLRILRYAPEDADPPHHQSYEVPHFDHMDLIDAFRYIQDVLDPSLAFRYSCEEGKCGLCGVLANQKPVLACKHTLDNAASITVDPLPGFPVIRDLVVDRKPHYQERRKLQKLVESATVTGHEARADRFTDYMAFENCVECSLCARSCPAAPSSVYPHVGPAGFLQAVRTVLLESTASHDGLRQLFRCFLCGQCERICPHGVAVPTLNRRARGAGKPAQLWPSTISSALTVLGENKVLLGKGGSGTALWLEQAPSRMRQRAQTNASLGIFVGCQFGVRRSLSRTPLRLAELLESAGVNFALLGSEEWCCGHPNYMAGDVEAASRFAEHNLNAFRELGVTEILAACPGCYSAWKSEYPELLGTPLDVDVWHTSELLVRLVDDGRIRVGRRTIDTAAYHDPCELGRLHGICDAPRRLIQLAGAEVVEFARSREDAHCCGGGGLVPAADYVQSTQATQSRIEELLGSPFSALVTACPNCQVAFATTLRGLGQGTPVLDIIDLLYLSAGLAANPGGCAPARKEGG